MTWYSVATVGEIPNGTYKAVDIEDESLLIIYLDNQYYAIKNRCTHEASPLAGGELEGDEITCPLHGARFCIKTGEATLPPAYEPVDTYPAKVENGVVYVDL